MSSSTFSSREFNQDTSRAKKAASKGPVFITDRGRPAHVLLSIRDYQRLVSREENIIETLGRPAGIEAVKVEFPRFRERARLASLT